MWGSLRLAPIIIITIKEGESDMFHYYQYSLLYRYTCINTLQKFEEREINLRGGYIPCAPYPLNDSNAHLLLEMIQLEVLLTLTWSFVSSSLYL